MVPTEPRSAADDWPDSVPEYIDDPIPRHELIQEQQEAPGEPPDPPDRSAGGGDFIDDPIPRRELIRDIEAPLRFVLGLLALLVGLVVFLVALLRYGPAGAKDIWLLISPFLFLILGYYFRGRREKHK